jgi:hypothetical protein
MPELQRSRLRTAGYTIPLLGRMLRRQDTLLAQTFRLAKELRELQAQTTSEFERVREILQFIQDDEPGNRRRLWDIRTSESYERAFTSTDPLVSVIIPTYTNIEGLVNVAVPSVLAQTYANWELMIVGDSAPQETGEALAAFGDARISYYNRERRGPYPDDRFLLRYVMAGPPYNEAVRRSHGDWIAPFADDDAYRPHALEALVRAAQKHRHEFCYSKVNRYEEDASVTVIGEWPPESRKLSLLGSIYHAGLSFIEYELADLPFRISGDMSILRRWLHAGVWMGWVDDPLVDYYWKPRRRDEFE